MMHLLSLLISIAGARAKSIAGFIFLPSFLFSLSFIQSLAAIFAESVPWGRKCSFLSSGLKNKRGENGNIFPSLLCRFV